MSMGFEVKIVFSFCKLTKIATFYKYLLTAMVEVSKVKRD